MNIQLCLVPPLLSNAGPGSHRGEGLSMQSSRMARRPRYCHTLYTFILIIRDSGQENFQQIIMDFSFSFHFSMSRLSRQIQKQDEMSNFL